MVQYLKTMKAIESEGIPVTLEVILIVEDTYGGEFFKRVLQELNETNLLPYKVKLKKLSGRRNPIHAPYLCNPKLKKIITATDMANADRIILIYDGDGPSNYSQRFNQVKSHIPAKTNTPIKIVLFEYEVEEWICKSLDIKWDSKPSDALKRKVGYKKSQLPKYVSKLNFEDLSNSCKSFQEFLNALR